MPKTKSSISVKPSVLEAVIYLAKKILFFSVCVFFIVYLFAITRIFFSDISFKYIFSDDYYLIADFLVIWGIVALLPAGIVEVYKGIKARQITFLGLALLQFLLLYFAVYLLSQDPSSEIESSALPLLTWLSLPLSALFYPLFFNIKSNK